MDCKRLKLFRLENDFTLEVMSKAIGITPVALAKIEKGQVKPSDRSVYKIYKAFPAFARICPDYEDMMTVDQPKTQPKVDVAKVRKQRKKADLPLFSEKHRMRE